MFGPSFFQDSCAYTNTSTYVYRIGYAKLNYNLPYLKVKKSLWQLLASGFKKKL